MNLYLDEDVGNPTLARLLRRAGHDVQLTSDAGMSGAHDAHQLRHAIRANRIIISGNHRDFGPMNDLVLESQGHHPGIWIVRKDNDRKRDLTHPGIVRAIANFLATGSQVHDQIIVLNQWR